MTVTSWDIQHEGGKLPFDACISYRHWPDSDVWNRSGAKFHLVRSPLETVYSAAAIWADFDQRVKFLGHLYGGVKGVADFGMSDNPLLDCMRSVYDLNARALAHAPFRICVEDIPRGADPKHRHNWTNQEKIDTVRKKSPEAADRIWRRVEPSWEQLFELDYALAGALRAQSLWYGYAT